MRLAVELRARGFNVFNFAEYDRRGRPSVTKITFDFDCPCGNIIHESVELARSRMGSVAELNAMILRARVELERHVRGDGL